MSYGAGPPLTHTHDSHEFYFCADGHGWQYTDEGEVAMTTGQVWLFPAGMRHIARGAPQGGTIGVVLNLYPQALDVLGEGGLEAREILKHLVAAIPSRGPLLPLSRVGEDQARVLFAELEDEHRRKAPGFRSAIAAGLHRLMIAFLRDPGTGQLVRQAVHPASDDERIAEVLRFLRQHYRQPIAIPGLARMAGLSRSRFHTVFRRTLGTTPIAFVNRLRIEEAKLLLRKSDRTVTDVALAIGFGSLSQFYDQFRRLAGACPRSWRRAAG